MSPELAPAFDGPFAWFASSIVTVDDPRPRITARELVEGSIIPQIMDAQQRKHPEGHISAFAAMWARFYATKLIVAAIGASLLINRRLPVTLDDVGVIFDDNGMLPVAIVLADLAEVETGRDAFDRFEPMVFEHLDVLFETLSQHGRVGRKVLWGDAALGFNRLIDKVAAIETRPLELLRFDPGLLLSSPTWRDGRPNPLFEPTIMVNTPNGPQRRRKTCCLLHRFGPDAKFCGGCPVAAKKRRRGACVIEAA